jgi:hypothetical protein
MCTDISIDELQEALACCSTKRLKAPRTLTLALSKIWAQFLQSILLLVERNENKARLLFWLAPALLAVGCKGVQSRTDFKRVRNHIEALQGPAYLYQCVRAIIAMKNQPHEPATSAASEAKRFHTMIQRGLFLKAIDTSDVTLAPSNIDVDQKLQTYFPKRDLPPPIPVQPNYGIFTPNYGEIAKTIRRMKRGKAPGFSGWTRELIWPLFEDVREMTQLAVCKFFSMIANVDKLYDVERNLLRDGILHAFQYTSKPEKIRPVTGRELFTKITWTMLLDSVPEKDPLLKKSGECFLKPGGCQTVVHCVNEALFQDRFVVCLDAHNAFNELKRDDVMKHYEKHPTVYQKAFRFINMTYATASQAHRFAANGLRTRSIDVTTGTFQGCCSSNTFFSTGVAIAMRGIPTANAMDDINLLGPESLNDIPAAINSLAKQGLDVLGEKTKLLCSLEKYEALQAQTNEERFESYPGLKQHWEHLKDKWVAEPTILVGGIVCPNGDKDEEEDIQEQFERVIIKATKRAESLINVEGSKQDKLLCLRHLGMCYQYYAATTLVPPHIHRRLFAIIDTIHRNCWKEITGIDPMQMPNASMIRLFQPVEDRGFGIFPYEHCGWTMLQQAATRAREMITQLNLKFAAPTDPDIPANFQTLWQSWKSFSIGVGRVKGRWMPTSWLSIRPITRMTTLDDCTTEFYCKLLTGMLEPVHYWCPQVNKYIDQLTESEDDIIARNRFIHHIMSCTHCGSSGFILRHDKVASALARTLRYHMIACQYEPKDCPLKDRGKGGPDLLVFVDDTPTMIDVAVCKDDNIQNSIASTIKNKESQKRAKYDATIKNSNYNMVPFVMSIYGAYGKAAIDVIEHWQQEIGIGALKADILQHTTMALITGLYNGYLVLSNRNSDYAKNNE